MRIESLLIVFFCSNVNCKGDTDDACSSGVTWDFSVLKNNFHSPIDIITSLAVRADFSPLRFTAINDNDVICDIINTGTGVAIRINSTDEKLKPQLSGAFLRDKYIFDNLHFHWGKMDDYGSDHFLNGESFSFEGHMSMYKREYKNMNNALHHKDGVINLVFFAQIGKSNKYLDSLLQFFPQIAKGNACGVKAASAEPIIWFLRGVDANETGDYFIYPGAMISPPFIDMGTFIVLPEPVPISHNQLQSFRTILNEQQKPILTNRREINPLRGRPILCASNIQWNIKTKIGSCKPLIPEKKCSNST